VEARFVDEDSRTHHYLYRLTSEPLRDILKEHLLSNHLHTVIAMQNSGLDVMIDLGKIDDLARMYKLFIMVPNLIKRLRAALKESITRRGREINNASLGTVTGNDGQTITAAPKSAAQVLELALKWVQDVLDLKDKFDAVWKQAFRGDRDIESTLNEVGHLFPMYELR
jgi:cullin 3